MYDKKIREELIATVKQLLADTHPELEVKLQTANKNNGISKDAITFVQKAGAAMIAAPVFYLDDLMEKQRVGEDYNILDAAELLIRMYEQAVSDELNADVRHMFEQVEREKIIPEIVNRNMNAEMLAHTPHRVIADDLALIARYEVTDHGSANISDEFAARFCLTPAEVLDTAISNANGNVQPMAVVMAGMMGISEEDAVDILGDNGMYIVSNKNRVYGAAAIFVDRDLRKETAEIIGGDFLIIPSSIHECICVSADIMSPKEANDMICEVNSGELLPEEILSDHCYLVNAETLKITNPMVQEKATKNQAEKHAAQM